MRRSIARGRLRHALRSEPSRDTKRALIEALWNGPTGIALFGADLRFVRVNDALAALNGLSPRRVGRSLGEILRLTPDDPRREAVARVEATVRAVLESGRPQTNVPIAEPHLAIVRAAGSARTSPWRSSKGVARASVRS